MDLFSIQTMIDNGVAPTTEPCAPSPGPSSPSASFSSHFRLPPPHSPAALSPVEVSPSQMPTSSLPNAFPPPWLPSAAAAAGLLQADAELLRTVALQVGTLAPSLFGAAASPFPPSASSSSASPSLNALLLLLLQQFRALSNGQSAVPFCSVLPLCVPPDFRSLFLADWTTKNAVADSLAVPSSAYEHQKQTHSLPFSDFCASSSGSCGGSGELSPGAGPKAFGAGGTAHRLSYPREFKLLVLKSFWANGQNKYRTCKEFQITKSMLNGWLQKADRIRKSRPGSLKSGRSGRRPQFPKIEQRLFELVQKHQLSAGECVSNKWIRKMAEKLTTAAGEQCQFSERWLNNFKRRHGIQTTAEDTVNTERDEETDDDETDRERQTDAILVEAVSPSLSPSPFYSTDELWRGDQWRSIASEICAGNRLPIQAFFDRFPKVLQQTSGAKRAGNGAKSEAK